MGKGVLGGRYRRCQTGRTPIQDGEMGTLYKTLRKLGVRDNSSIEEQFFSPEEFRNPIMKVSEHRYEREREDKIATLEMIPLCTDVVAKEASAELGEEMTWLEFEKEITKMFNGAAGNDGVCPIAVTNLNDECKLKVFDFVGTDEHGPRTERK